MNHPFLNPGSVLVSDIAAGNAETLCGGGTRTLAALTDLVNICQAAVLHDLIIASPIALENSSLLGQLDCVRKWSFKKEDSKPEHNNGPTRYTPNDLASGGEGDSFTADELFLVMANSLAIRLEDPIFGNLVNLSVMEPEVDKGKYAIEKLPAAMLLFQALHGDDIFTNDEAKEAVLRAFAPSLPLLRNYSSSLVTLYEVYGVNNVTSTIEQPLLDSGRLDLRLGSSELDDIYREISKRIDYSVEKFRGLMLSRYKLPAVGLHVLSRARDSDDIPRVIVETRGKFEKLRRSITDLECERKQAFEAGEYGYKDLLRIKLNLSKAFDAFSEKITDEYITRDVRRVDRVMDGAKLFDQIMGLVTSLGMSALSSVQSTLEKLKVKRRMRMRLVPGLFTAAATLENMQIDTVGSLVERYLELPPERFAFPQIALGFCFKRIETLYDPSVMDETAGITIAGIFLPAKELWARMLKDEVFANVFLTGHLDSRNE